MATTLVSPEEYLNTSYPDGDREYVDGRVVERNMGEIDHAGLQTRIVVYLATHYPQVWAAVEVRVQVKPTRFRVPDVTVVLGPEPAGRIITTPPLVVVEVLSRDDRVDDLEEKIQDYLEFGVPAVWVLNPRTRRAHIHTVSGSYEAKDGILRTPGPVIEVPLAEVLSPTSR